MFRPGRRILLGFLGIIWLTVIVSLYYVWHKPVTIPAILRIASALGQFIAALGVLSVGGGLGKRLLRVEQPGLAWMAVQAGIGCGVLSLGLLIFGATVGVSAVLAWFALLALGVILARDILGWWDSLLELKKIWIESPVLGRWIAIGLGLILLATLTAALSPPLKFDALVYHLALPRYYQLAGRVVYTPWLVYWGMPQTGEMLYTWASALAGVESAATLGWMIGALAIVGLVGYVFNRLGVQAAWVSAAALLAGFTFSTSLAWAYVDWLEVLFGLGVLVSLESWISTGYRRHLILAGGLTGMALGSKYTGGVIFIGGVSVVVWQLLQRKEKLSMVLIDLVRFLLPAMLITIPWWIKNLLATGNPAYPFFFPSGVMDRFRLNFYNIPIWGDWRDAVFLPLLASFTGVEGAPGYNASIGPLLLGLSVCALFGWTDRDESERLTVKVATIIGVVGIIVWMVAARLSGYLIQTRLYAAILPALAILAGAGFKALSQMHWVGIRLGRVAGALVLVVWSFSVLEVSRYTLGQGAPQEVLGILSPEDYLNKNLGWFARANQAVKALPEGSKALMLWEPRSLYCLPKCVPDEIIDRWKHDLSVYQEPEAILESWRSMGYSHLMLYRSGADFVRGEDRRYSPGDWEALDALLSNLPPPVDLGGAYLLYRLNP